MVRWDCSVMDGFACSVIVCKFGALRCRFSNEEGETLPETWSCFLDPAFFFIFFSFKLWVDWFGPSLYSSAWFSLMISIWPFDVAPMELGSTVQYFSRWRSPFSILLAFWLSLSFTSGGNDFPPPRIELFEFLLTPDNFLICFFFLSAFFNFFIYYVSSPVWMIWLRFSKYFSFSESKWLCFATNFVVSFSYLFFGEIYVGGSFSGMLKYGESEALSRTMKGSLIGVLRIYLFTYFFFFFLRPISLSAIS